MYQVDPKVHKRTCLEGIFGWDAAIQACRQGRLYPGCYGTTRKGLKRLRRYWMKRYQQAVRANGR